MDTEQLEGRLKQARADRYALRNTPEEWQVANILVEMLERQVQAAGKSLSSLKTGGSHGEDL